MKHLTQIEIQQIKSLRTKGARVSFIGKFANAYYGVARSTVYRYISPNKDLYDPQLKAEKLAFIQNKLCQGKTSQEIAHELGEDLGKINKLIVNNHLSVWKCQL